MQYQSSSKLARKELIQQSRQAKKEQSKIISLTGEVKSINLILVANHHERTGAKVLMRFDEWKKLGFQVKKNSKSVRIWGKKRKTKINNKDKSSYAFYPMCCLFSESQVTPLNDNSKIDVVIEQYQDHKINKQIH